MAADPIHLSDPDNPADTSPLTIERDLAESGQDGEFTVLSGARMRCETCGATSPASGQDADDLARTEGASDPADMTMVLSLTCPECGTSGSVTLAYGPDAGPDTSDFIVAVPRSARPS